jgi:hypothetical protein
MSQQPLDSLPVGLTEAEKEDLEEMIVAFRRDNPTEGPEADRESLQSQLDDIVSKLADLTEMILNIDRRLAPLAEVIRLSHQKSELLSQRLDTVIAALKKGHML